MYWVVAYTACKAIGKKVVIVPPNILDEVLNHYKSLAKISLLISNEVNRKLRIDQCLYFDLLEEKSIM